MRTHRAAPTRTRRTHPQKIQTAVAEWPTYAARAIVRPEYIAPIAKAHRMEIA